MSPGTYRKEEIKMADKNLVMTFLNQSGKRASITV
jgi:hypothetical protein